MSAASEAVQVPGLPYSGPHKDYRMYDISPDGNVFIARKLGTSETFEGGTGNIFAQCLRDAYNDL